MRIIGCLAAILGLAACNAEAESVEATGPSAGDPGTYTRTMADGLINTTLISADGRYLTIIGNETSEGKVRTDGDKTCFVEDAKDAIENCWTNGPIRPGGTFESTSNAGETYTITYSPDIPTQDEQPKEMAD